MSKTEREQYEVLILCLDNSALNSDVLVWSLFSPLNRVCELEVTPPYQKGIDALADGWALLQASPIRNGGAPLPNEFIFQRAIPRGAIENE